jgi:hypothetical protein
MSSKTLKVWKYMVVLLNYTEDISMKLDKIGARYHISNLFPYKLRSKYICMPERNRDPDGEKERMFGCSLVEWLYCIFMEEGYVRYGVVMKRKII